MLEIFTLLAVCFTPTLSIHCEQDLPDLNVKNDQYTVQVDNVGDFEHWRTAQNNFQVFGRFDGDPSSSVITASYYTEKGQLIHGITIDCGTQKWSSQITRKEAKTDEAEDWLKGDLAAPCTADAEFDIWFKIHQPKLMSWIFNGQPLQYETRETTTYRGAQRIDRTRTMEVPTKHGSNKGHVFKVKVTGAATVTRVTWGQCVSWPLSMNNNCQGARLWVQARSKMPTTANPGGLGHFGSDWQTFSPTCFLGSRYYNWLQQTVHPDRNSLGYPYCCCVDMVTGLTIDSDEHACITGSMDGSCDRSCMQYAKQELIEEIMIEQDLSEEDMDENVQALLR